MSKIVSRTVSSFVAALPLALAVVGSSVSAQTLQPQPRTLGIYGGINAGIGVYEWDCGTSCGRTAFSGKLFGGKRLTPGLAAEVNYMFFGRVENANDPDRQQMIQWLDAWDPSYFVGVRAMLDQSNALEASRQVIDGLLNTARECTAALPDTAETRALYALAADRGSPAAVKQAC